jgi:hypothetical protein
MGNVILDRNRIGDATARESQALLILEIRMVFDIAEAQLVRAACEEIGGDEGSDILHRHRAIGDAAFSSFHFNHGFKPQQTARAIAHDLHIGKGSRHLVRAHGAGG